MNTRTRSRLNMYGIAVNGQYVANVSAQNTRSAILLYCRSNNIQVGGGQAYGECGTPTSYCSKSLYNGFRACGRRGKCIPNYIIETGIGIMTAFQTSY